MSTVFGPLIAAASLTVALIGWEATIFARSNFADPRNRILNWCRDVGHQFELAHIPGHLDRLAMPPFPYQLRSYLHHDLRRDLDLLEDYSRTGSHWNLSYVEPSVIERIQGAMQVVGQDWRARHGVLTWAFEPQAPPDPFAYTRQTASIGLQRIGMLQEQVLEYQRATAVAIAVMSLPFIGRRWRRRRERARRRHADLSSLDSPTDWMPS